MIFDDVLFDGDITLRCIKLEDCTEEYAGWLNNKEINKYLECRFYKHTAESVKDFVSSILKSGNDYMFAILYKTRHIGNIKLGSINTFYSKADVGYVIGTPEYYGKGIATKCVQMVTNFGFEKLNLHRIYAGCFEKNIGSRRVLEKAGYTLEGILKKDLKVYEDSDYQDHYIFGIINDKKD